MAGRLINRFGAQAVYGRALGYGEMRRILLAENVERVAQRFLAKDSAKWFQAHPNDLKLLTWAKEASTHV
jgi:hypothetical protein